MGKVPPDPRRCHARVDGAWCEADITSARRPHGQDLVEDRQHLNRSCAQERVAGEARHRRHARGAGGSDADPRTPQIIDDSGEPDGPVDTDALDELAGLEDELEEVTDFLAAIDVVLEANNGKDSKYDRFEELLRDTVIAGPHRTCIVFTQYTDTMDWLRDHLAATLGSEKIACYSGRGGELPNDDGTWRTATKTEVTTAFRPPGTAGPWRVTHDPAGSFELTLDPTVALETDADLAVWGHPALSVDGDSDA